MFIRKKILLKILLIPEKYIIKGSFRIKIPYVTNIDVIREVYPEINENNIYEKILLLKIIFFHNIYEKILFLIDKIKNDEKISFLHMLHAE
jgi:hypothetical protein